MKSLWLVILGCCACFAMGFDIGPIVRIAQCRSQCLRKHSSDGSCDWVANRGETTCSECWQNCEALETQWEDARTVCEGEQYLRCPACQTACGYHKSRVEEKYLPSMLPAPKKGPVILGKFDVAVVMRSVRGTWKEAGYYPSTRTPTLRPDTWIIVIVEEGIEQYSWQDWVPRLDSLKEGPLYEATVSWKDRQNQLQRQRDSEQKRFNDRVRQFFLEKYGEKVLAEWRTQEDSQISEEVFRRFFFRRKDERADRALENDSSPSTTNSLADEQNGHKETYVVSWEPETGGLIGNQVTDANSAQISLLPGMKYLVRIASNDGPGSFAIEVDTRPPSEQVTRAKITIWRWYSWDVYLACTCAVILLLVVGLSTFFCKHTKTADVEEV